MTPDEAVQDAIETCQVQGGDLYFVIKRNVESDGRHMILHLVDGLIDNPTETALEHFAEECRTFECRHYAATEYKAHGKLAEKIATMVADPEQRGNMMLYIRALTVLLKGQPDWVNNFIILLLRKLVQVWEGLCENAKELMEDDWTYIADVSKFIEICSKSHEGMSPNQGFRFII